MRSRSYCNPHQHANRYFNQHSNRYFNQHANRYFNQHANRYSNQHANRYFNQHSNDYPYSNNYPYSNDYLFPHPTSRNNPRRTGRSAESIADTAAGRRIPALAYQLRGAGAEWVREI